jgi:hypothetical protein
MKNGITKYLFISASMLAFFVQPLLCQQKTDTGYQYVEEAYHSAQGLTHLDIQHKHGNLMVQAWNQDSIKIISSIQILSKNLSLVEEIYKQIEVRQHQSASVFYLKTKFDEDFHSNFPFSIDYQVFIPSNTHLNIKSGFGDIHLTNIEQTIHIEAEHGQLKMVNDADQIYPNIVLTSNFMDVSIQKADSMTLTLHNSLLNLEKCKVLEGQSNFSQLMVKEGHSASITSTIDRITFGSLDSIRLTGQKTICKIKQLKKYGFIEITDGSLRTSIEESLDELNIANNGAYTEIGLPRNWSYTLHGEVKEGQFSHEHSEQLQILHDRNTISFSGTIGAHPTGTLVLFNSNASLNLKTY